MSTQAPYDSPAADGRHPVHVTHLVMGLVFLGIVLVWALVQADLVGGDDVRWLLPVPWVLAGGAGLLATTLSARRRRDAGDLRGTGPTGPAGFSDVSDVSDPDYPDYPMYPTDPADPTEEIR